MADQDLHESPSDVEPTAADTSTVSAVLNAAADLLMAKGWCKDYYAKDRYGVPTEPLCDDAARFCAIGAIDRVTGQDFHSYLLTRDYLMGHIGSVANWNDRLDQRRSVVVAKLREVAALAAAEAK